MQTHSPCQTGLHRASAYRWKKPRFFGGAELATSIFGAPAFLRPKKLFNPLFSAPNRAPVAFHISSSVRADFPDSIGFMKDWKIHLSPFFSKSSSSAVRLNFVPPFTSLLSHRPFARCMYGISASLIMPFLILFFASNTAKFLAFSPRSRDAWKDLKLPH